MSTAVTRARPFLFTSLVVAAFACSNVAREPYLPYRYPWNYRGLGTYAVVRRPVDVVDKWTSRAFESRRYHRYHVLRTEHAPIAYTAVRRGDTLQVRLLPMGDSTALQVRSQAGQTREREQARARALMGEILKDYK